MNTAPNDAQLIQLYREWWKDSYGVEPNSQNAAIAAAFARHVLDTYQQSSPETEIIDYYAQLKAQQGSDKCVYHPGLRGEDKADD